MDDTTQDAMTDEGQPKSIDITTSSVVDMPSTDRIPPTDGMEENATEKVRDPISPV